MTFVLCFIAVFSTVLFIKGCISGKLLLFLVFTYYYFKYFKHKWLYPEEFRAMTAFYTIAMKYRCSKAADNEFIGMFYSALGEVKQLYNCAKSNKII